MEETNAVETKPAETQATQVVQDTKQAETQAVETKEAPKEDLVTRASKVKIEQPKPAETNPFGISREEYETVLKDPVLSKYYKSMQADYTRKQQQTADERRELDTIKKQLQQSQSWSKERLQEEMNKPDFIQAAQALTAVQNPPNSGLSNEEYSALTDKEKAQLQEQTRRIQSLEMQNWQMLQKQQDEQLKGRYANYAPDIVDTTIHKLVKGEIKADREVVWKALDYDAAVQRAYELGKQDRALENKDKAQSLSVEGFSATPQGEVPQPEKGESNTAYFKRIANRRLAEQQLQRQTR